MSRKTVRLGSVNKNWLFISLAFISIVLLFAMAACTQATPTPVPTATPRPTSIPVPTATSVPTSTANVVQTAEPLTKLDVSVGSPPAAGWAWAIMMHENGKHDVTEAKDSHDLPWMFFVTRGSEEIGTADGTKTINADGAILIPGGLDHTHRYLPQTHVLGLRLGPATSIPGDYHGGYPGIYFTGKVLETNPGTNYNMRVREYTLNPGERRADSTIVEPNFVFVINGTLTSRPSSGSVTTTETYKVGVLPLNVKLFLSNEGKDPLKFIIVDLHQ